jgi:uncharacterized membrane protein
MATVTRLSAAPSKLEVTLGILPWLLLAALFVFALIVYPGLPAQLPSHFNLCGTPDATASKTTIWVLLGVFLLIELVMSVLIRFPGAFNMPVKVDDGNRAALVRLSMQLMRAIKLAIALLAWLVVAAVLGDVAGPWIMPLTLVFVFLPLGYYLNKMWRLRS